MLRETPFESIPTYLRSVSILEKEGNTAADVVAAVASHSGEKSKRVKWVIGLTLVVLVAFALATTLFLAPDSSSPSSLTELRKEASRFGATEYIADGETVPINAYPSLVEVAVNRPAARRWAVRST